MLMKRRGAGALKASFAACVALLVMVAVLSCGGDSKPPAQDTRSPQAASLGYPIRITDAGQGNLAVTDYTRSRVVFVNSDTLEEVRHFTVPGKPLGVVVADDKVFVGIPERTENGRQKGGNVNAFSTAGRYLYTMGSAFHGYGAVKNPTDIAVDEADDRIFVLDAFAKNVKAYMINGTYVSEFLVGSTAQPNSMAIDTENDLLYIGDSFGYYSSGMLGVTIRAGIRTFDYSGNASPMIDVISIASEYKFSRPMGLALDLQGHLLVSDIIQSRVVVLNTTGEGVRAFAPDAVVEGTSFMPMDLHVDSGGDVFISEGGNSRITVLRGEGL